MIFVSPYPSIAEPPTQDLASFIFDHADEHSAFGANPSLPALTDHVTMQSFMDVQRMADRFASGLVNNLGLQRGDMVALLIPNTVYYPAIVLGALMAGLVCVTANPAYTVGEIAHVLNLSEAKAVIATKENLSTVLKTIQTSNSYIMRHRILTIDGRENTVHGGLSDKPYNRVRLITEEQARDTPAFLLLSSGTTGLPKGVLLSHANIVSNIMQNIIVEAHDPHIAAAESKVPQQACMACTPYFHSYGLVVVMLLSIVKGRHQIIMSKFDLEQFCILTKRYQIAVAHIVPPVVIQLAKNPIVDKYDLTSLSYVCSGGAPLTRETQTIFREKHGVCILQAYGLSETSPVSHRAQAKGAPDGSVGYLLPSMECMIIGDSGERLGTNELGELCMRGPNIMMGYFKNAQATAQTIDKDGFLHTGDIGQVDDNGFYFIEDRKKELIKYKGFQVAPAELEGLLMNHPAVLDAAVIQVFDKAQETEIPKAFVVVRPSITSERIAEDIKAWVKERVANYKALRGGIELIDSIPKSASGKILRRVLRDIEARRLQTAKL
ncbi:hypothetical protein GGI03_004223 [Coemansia sp. RSA 2337]|nr:hypothetical protein GGI14_003521 [Coemansia sp. S680]KAJ2043375.1 hypothetical protein H4S04_006793 [Coemansia sp. S16]KAJ2057193.1 hypothetical protein GGH13_007382 [Coemansia sp. S155-1]KAJ2108190.1 hypothetical protein IW146_006958 [Coemansia sp. RSA 922]KAJ2353191.1 hypothetical protein GGH92_000815 [Coemansia sp. RSA 2673]KAJ2430691.1 hypothetical protein GGF41_000880 [Coemansia sp. RSA 2531]KAJ2462839.1 hypothetical protein GGI03_004223 [Coemansia sp. RSA 2337]